MMADKEIETLIKFKANSNIIVTGQSHAGKTTFVFSLLKQLDLFESNIKHILYAFGMWQALFEQMEREIKSISFVHGIPNKETLEKFSSEYGSILLVLDDVMGQSVNSIEVMNLFTTYSHHLGITVIFLLQNIFPPGRYMRTISLNAHYIILFKNPRDEQQVKTLGRQIFPSQSKYFLDSYKKATNIPYSYLCVTLYPGTVEKFRLSTKIFPQEETILYLPM
jgi:ABC-type phosphate/phosphonate transport system ATPase subunit